MVTASAGPTHPCGWYKRKLVECVYACDTRSGNTTTERNSNSPHTSIDTGRTLVPCTVVPCTLVTDVPTCIRYHPMYDTMFAQCVLSARRARRKIVLRDHARITHPHYMASCLLGSLWVLRAGLLLLVPTSVEAFAVVPPPLSPPPSPAPPPPQPLKDRVPCKSHGFRWDIDYEACYPWCPNNPADTCRRCKVWAGPWPRRHLTAGLCLQSCTVQCIPVPHTLFPDVMP